jgi:hypothetical protein
MTFFKIKCKYDEPMVADAIFKGEDEDAAREGFLEFSAARGMLNLEILDIEEISEEEATQYRRAYEATTEVERKLN